jgi:FMN phosphatase YigB (HAD superfamily)
MRRLAFLDLDLTLFDYTTVRREATALALEAMGIAGIAKAAEFIDAFLVPNGDVLTELGLPNFRRAWKAPELFALVYAIAQDGALQEHLGRIVPALAEDDRSFDGRLRRRELVTEEAQRLGIHDLAARVRAILGSETRPVIDEALRVFDQYLWSHVDELPGAGALLDTLEARGFESYVVSEGDEQIQLGKLQLLESGERLMGNFITGACCRSDELLAKLWTLGVETPDPAVRAAAGALYDAVLPYSMKTSTFFRKLLQTLLLPPEMQPDFFRDFGWLTPEQIASAPEVGLLVIGDRYDKDLLPAFSAFGNAIGIRLEFGKYSALYDEATIAEQGLRAPLATVQELHEVARTVAELSNLPAIDKERIVAPPCENSLEQAVAVVRSHVSAATAASLERLAESCADRGGANGRT